MMNNALCSMSWMFSGFYCVPHCAINIWHHRLCYLPLTERDGMPFHDAVGINCKNGATN